MNRLPDFLGILRSRSHKPVGDHTVCLPSNLIEKRKPLLYSVSDPRSHHILSKGKLFGLGASGIRVLRMYPLNCEELRNKQHRRKGKRRLIEKRKPLLYSVSDPRSHHILSKGKLFGLGASGIRVLRMYPLNCEELRNKQH